MEGICSREQDVDATVPENAKPKPKKTKKKTKAGLLPKLNKNYVPLWDNGSLETLVLKTEGYTLK
jgi:hypothetical protein